MAITGVDYQFWKHLRDENLLPEDPDVLELGQANWYGDLDPACLVDDVRKYAKPDVVEQLLARLTVGDVPDEPLVFGQARVFYKAVLQFKSTMAIDLHGIPGSFPMDLNKPIAIRNRDILINSGTAEHVFGQSQFFRTCHDAVRQGGLMVHMLPCWGWLDHGFYNYHPTFVADLAAANGYEVVRWWFYDLGKKDVLIVRRPQDIHTYAKQYGMAGSTMHAIALKKTTADAFKTPMQGYYAGTLSAELNEAWRTMR